MATVNRTVPEGLCRGGQKTVSAARNIGDRLSSIFVRLTSSEWAAKSGTGSISRWGVEASTDGILWTEHIIVNDIPFGALDRGGGLPLLFLSGGNLDLIEGYRARVFVEPTADIRMGAEIEAVTD
jgi:hypothetical protein